MVKNILQQKIDGKDFIIQYDGDWIARERAMEDDCKEMMATRIVGDTIPKDAFVAVNKRKMNEKSIVAGGTVIMDDSIFVIEEVSPESCVIKCKDVRSKHYLMTRTVPTIYLIELKSN